MQVVQDENASWALRSQEWETQLHGEKRKYHLANKELQDRLTDLNA